MQVNPRVRHAQIPNKLVPHERGTQIRHKEIQSNENRHQNSFSLEILVCGWRNTEESPMVPSEPLPRWALLSA